VKPGTHMASKGLSAILATEVEITWATTVANRPAPADQGCCDREPDLGRGTDCR
jgi:hypothetical protein